MSEYIISHDMGSPIVRCRKVDPYENCTKEIPKKIRICLFFDGTQNNRTNVSLGQAGAPLIGSTGSYHGFYTNIARLETVYMEDMTVDFSASIYIEGIGTENKKSDNLKGLMFGTGTTGIQAKVEQAINNIVDTLVGTFKNYKTIEYVCLDAFGFSRGAAAARNLIFASLLKKGETLIDRLTDKGFSISAVKFEFIGLFDTVASHGLNHSDDTEELHLDYIDRAKSVVQLAAADEHRRNFRLTNIDSTPDGLQIFLPGAHSDVGGGYLPIENEKNLKLFEIISPFVFDKQSEEALRREQEYFLTSGWYTVDEINVQNSRDSDTSIRTILEGNRKNISNEYSLIPLQLMAEFAGKNGVIFDISVIMDKFRIPDDLNDAKNLIDDYIANLKNSSPSTPNDWIKPKMESTKQILNHLRHGFLHFSSDVSVANYPQYTDENEITGIRERIIQNG